MDNQAIEATETPERVAEVLRRGAHRLVSAGIVSGRLDAEVLLAHVLHSSRDRLLLVAKDSISGAQEHAYEELLARRLEREPVAYIVGRREFWSLDFYVTRDVLIPRPETERLVEIGLDRARKLGHGGRLYLADLGTGSGAVAVALAKELPRAEILAVDSSIGALAIARRNAARHGVADRIEFIQSDLFKGIGARPRFHLIVANPPYVPRSQIAGLDPEVSLWEPRAALDGGVDGLDCYRRIAAEAFNYLAAAGQMAVEIGSGTAGKVAALLRAAGWNDITVYDDYAANDRVVTARAPRAISGGAARG